MRPEILVVVTADIVQQIEALCADAPGVETGGLVVLDGGYSCVTGPGPLAARGPQLLEWDPSYIAGVLEVAGQLGSTVYARWHKHTSPVILASADDRQSAERFRQMLGMEMLVDVIVACGPDDRPIGWAAYVCSADGYERVGLTLSQEAGT